MSASTQAPASGDGGGAPDDLEFVPPSLQKMMELSSNLRSEIADLEVPNGTQGGDEAKDKSSKAVATSKQAVARKTGKRVGGKASEDANDDAATSEGAAKIETLQQTVHELQTEMKKRQESYVRREAQYKSQIDRMKQLLEKAVLCRTSSDYGMSRVRDLHTNIQSGISGMQQKTTKILEEHEKDMLRQFRARLFEVEEKLKKEQSKRDDIKGMSVEWVEKSTALVRELEKYREEAVRLDRSNESLVAENQRLKTQLKSQEDDREYLVRQLVALKKDNARLTKEIERAAAHSLKSAASGAAKSVDMPESPSTPVGFNDAKDVDGEIARYKDVTSRLRRLLDSERKSLRELRGEHLSLLQGRTELEGLLRQALDDVKITIAGTRKDTVKGAEGGASISTSALTKSDREKVLQLLLSQERVVSLLYDKTFPPRQRDVSLEPLNEQDEVEMQAILDSLPSLENRVE